MHRYYASRLSASCVSSVKICVLRWSTGDLQVLSELKSAGVAHHRLDKGCSRGTCTEIIEAIVCWALGADTPSSDPNIPMRLGSDESSRVLWLCGTTGAGNSSIHRSCAKCVFDERNESYYNFDKNKPLAKLTNLFSRPRRPRQHSEAAPC
jgi:hypothetical protein